MAYAMTKQGSLDNCVTYEFICDTVEDMNAIEDRYRTIGTVAIVLSGTSGLEVYIAGSDKQWNSLSSIGGSAASDTAGLSIYICAQNEVSEGVPDVELPDEQTLYLVPAAEPDSGNLYDEYIYVEDEWEKFGSGGSTIDLSAYATKASPVFTGSISMGRTTNSTVGQNSVAFGNEAIAIGDNSIAVGDNVNAQFSSSMVIGKYNKVIPNWEKNHAYAKDDRIFYEDHIYQCKTTHTSNNIFDDVQWNRVYRDPIFIIGSGTASTPTNIFTIYKNGSVEEGNDTYAYQGGAHAEGRSTSASGAESHAEGYSTIASGAESHAEGYDTIASGPYSHAEGFGGTFTLNNTSYTSGAQGTSDHIEGYQCLTSAGGQPGKHAEGYQTYATGGAAHAEGSTTVASGVNAHAEGNITTASGAMSHAEGYDNNASAFGAHVEGSENQASGSCAHAEGASNIASGHQAHAEGYNTIASGIASHVGGQFNIADNLNNRPEWIAGTSYKIGDKVKRTSGSTVTSYVCKTANNDSTFNSANWKEYTLMNYAEIVGNGTADNARSNARALDWNGNEYLMGDVYVGCNTNSTGGTKLPRIPEAPSTDGTYILQATVTNGTPTYSWVSLSSLSGVTF